MKGVKARIIEEYEQLKKDFNKYFFKVHKKEQYFDPLSGYDQLMLKPEQPKKLNGGESPQERNYESKRLQRYY